MNYITIWELGWGRRVGRGERRWREADREKKEERGKIVTTVQSENSDSVYV